MFFWAFRLARASPSGDSLVVLGGFDPQPPAGYPLLSLTRSTRKAGHTLIDHTAFNWREPTLPQHNHMKQPTVDLRLILLKLLNSPKRRYTIDEYMDPLKEMGFDDETIYSEVRQLTRDGLAIETGTNGYYLESTSDGSKVAQATIASLERTSANGDSLDSDAIMRLKATYEVFETAVIAFRSTLENLKRVRLDTEEDLAQGVEQLERTKKDCARYLREHTSKDIGNDLAGVVLNENRYRAQGVHPFAQRKKDLQDRVTNIISSMDYVLDIVRMSDPIMQARSFEQERADMTVAAKTQFLLSKLYELRKSSRYWDTNMIFDWNQVQMDDYDEARQIAKTLEHRRLVETIGYARGLGAKITTLGKEQVQRLQEPAPMRLDEPTNEFSKHPPFVHPERIQELEQLEHKDFDFRKLVQFCHELNDNYDNGNFLSVSMLGRSIMNHVPPIFGLANFNEVASNYGKQSFKKSMMNLNASLKNIADSYLHDPIRKKEVLPNATQVNFSHDMDVLLAEVVRKVSEGCSMADPT